MREGVSLQDLRDRVGLDGPERSHDDDLKLVFVDEVAPCIELAALLNLVPRSASAAARGENAASVVRDDHGQQGVAISIEEIATRVSPWAVRLIWIQFSELVGRKHPSAHLGRERGDEECLGDCRLGR
jgi:hypothetical protein